MNRIYRAFFRKIERFAGNRGWEKIRSWAYFRLLSGYIKTYGGLNGYFKFVSDYLEFDAKKSGKSI